MSSVDRNLRISDLEIVEFINCFSLLVVAGSVSTSYFFGQIYKAQLGISFYWLLASTIWVIYTFDHVLDGMKLKDSSISIRHYIHYKYRKSILPMLAALVIFNAYVAIAFLPQQLIQAGLVLSGFVVLYFFVVHYLKTKNITIPKELVVSVIVAFGMVVLPGVVGDMVFNKEAILMVLSMTLVNFANLLLFSYYDYENDIANGLTSAATQWGKEKTRETIMYVLAAAFICFTIWTFLIISPIKLPISIVLLIMFNILLVIYIQEDRFAKNELYRFWGDFIFLIPGLVWWLFVQRSFF